MAKSILTREKSKLIDCFRQNKLLIQNFYLSGGTALSEYYLHHRISEDLDFFSYHEIDTLWLTGFLFDIQKKLQIKKIRRRDVFNRNLVFLDFANESIKAEFTYYPFSQIEEPKVVENLRIDSLIDIAVNKFFTLYQKPSARHFIDLYLILTQTDYTFEILQKQARIKFDTQIDPIQLGTQLVKAKNISDLPKMIIRVSENKWRQFFLDRAKELKKQIIR